MRYARITADGRAVEVVDIEGDLADYYHADLIASFAPAPTEVDVDWTWDGSAWSAPVVEISPSAVRVALAASVQAHIDLTAQGRGYDSGLSCATYDGDPSPTFDAEAKAFRAWRSAVWTSCYATLAAVEAGTEAVPTAEDLISGLPVIAWP